MSNDKHLRCSFCGKSKDSVRKFISGPSVYICNECITLCNEILAEDEEREQTEARKPVPTPLEIKETLDEYVIGQDHAKRTLAVAVYNLYETGYTEPVAALAIINVIIIAAAIWIAKKLGGETEQTTA